MKKIIVLLVVLLLIASTIQVAFAEPPGPVPASCNMVNSWWLDEDGNWIGPGNPSPNGVKDGERGMVHVHTKDMPDHVGDNGYTYGAQHMDIICPG
jgi:hypothetical protein